MLGSRRERRFLSPEPGIPLIQFGAARRQPGCTQNGQAVFHRLGKPDSPPHNASNRPNHQQDDQAAGGYACSMDDVNFLLAHVAYGFIGAVLRPRFKFTQLTVAQLCRRCMTELQIVPSIPSKSSRPKEALTNSEL